MSFLCSFQFAQVIVHYLWGYSSKESLALLEKFVPEG